MTAFLRLLPLQKGAIALLLSLILLSTGLIQAQTIPPCGAVDDVLTITLGQPFSFNVRANDVGAPPCPVRLSVPDNCFELKPDGELTLIRPDDQNCCGSYELVYDYIPCDGGAPCSATVFVTVLCPKPDCFLINLEDYVPVVDPIGGPTAPCAYACENAQATYFVPLVSGNTYLWSVSGGSFVIGANVAEIIVSWGPLGPGSVSVVVTDINNQSTTLNLCVELLISPIAAFSANDSTLCLGSGVDFLNLSTGASSYFWDFGDGNNSTLFSPSHAYTSPGTYTVTLYATRDNYDDRGNLLCCCTDSTTLTITVDSLPGPGIFCISTLCAYSSSDYYTDATLCDTYLWTVLDADGNPLTFAGQGTPNISVNWGNGPVGTITLYVDGCDSLYCEDPTQVTVPIIPNTADINGALVVCENTTETYTLPKWISTLYTWSVSGGTILSGQGTNTVLVQWGLAPGPGVLSVNWASSFLGGLPGQNPEYCMGFASINVAIKPKFSISGPQPGVACVNSSSVFNASPSASYFWSVSPAAAFSGQGSSSIVVNWTTPGSYVITAVPNDTTAFCNSFATALMTVVLPAPPDSISGVQEICPGQTYTYFGYTSQPGMALNWAVTGGSPAFFTGDPIAITWNASGPYGIVLTASQINAPFCISDPISLSISPKLVNGPLSISGTGTCTNAQGTYVLSPAQHPDAVITWTISPALAGSVVSGQGSDSIQIQWNNSSGPVTLTATIELCGQSVPVSQLLNLSSATPPVITQIGILCPGVNATLDAGPGYSSYSWTTGDITQTTSISASGAYTVEVVDGNGCPASATFNAVALAGPVASISPPGPIVFCVDPPGGGSVTIKAQTNPGYTFNWFINGIPQGFPPTQDTVVHTNNNVVGSFTYQVVVTDANGCVNTSNLITVIQQDSCKGCTPEPHSVDFTPLNQFPNCNIVDFSTSTTGPVTLSGWNFGDPFGNTNTGTLANAQHTYIEAGSYLVTLSYQVAEAAPDTGFCTLIVTKAVDIPLAARFSSSDSCQKVSFVDLSTFLPGNSISSHFWTFGDANTSALPSPQHTYASPGTYWVTLTITSPSGCIAVIGDSVKVIGLPVPGISINPNPACVGEAVNFSGSGSGIVSWLWDFGNGAQNGAQNPQQSYLIDSLYPVSLTVVDNRGCSNTVFSSILINPAVPEDSISYAPSLSICEGDSVTLFAPAGPYTYLWSTGAVSSSIVTGTAGPYSLIITDPNGCSRELDPVTVVVIPKPIPFISGNPFICDNGCITLNATPGFGFSYAWLDDSGNPISGANQQTLSVCDSNLLAGYSVVITNANGCSDTSAMVSVSVAVSPSFSIAVVGDSCAGSPNVLSVLPVQSGVVYSWSNGGNGPSITVNQPGTYTAFGTDTSTGCSASASAIIHPLPDLCIVPAGCYTTCDPDTLCGPPGLGAYQWNFNGVPLSGETGQCLVVTMSGTYSLTGTSTFGCTVTSEDLDLEVTDCDEEETVCDLVDYELVPTSNSADSCCWSLSLSNSTPNFFVGVRLEALGGVNLGYSGSNAGWFTSSSSPSSVELLPPSLGFVPTGAYTGDLSDMASFCLSGYSSSPQQVVVSWLVPGPLPFEFMVECSDTLNFNCKPEGCVVVVYDTIYCDGDSIKYDFYLENASFSFDVLSFRINVDEELDVDLSQNIFNVAAIPPLGVGGPYSLSIGGADAVFGNSLMFTITAHNEPILDTVEQTYCCTDTVVIVVPFPDCDPCDFVSAQASQVEGEDCCYQITLLNNFSGTYFSGIQTQIITPGATFGSITGAYPLGWVYQVNSASDLNWIRIPLGSQVPLGSVPMPVICIGGTYPSTVQVVINWLTPGFEGDSVVCSDTLDLICTPNLAQDCAALINDTIYCDSNGNYVFEFQVVNYSGVSIDELVFSGLSPAGVSMGPILVSLANGDTSGVLTTIISGPGAIPGAVICFNISLHDMVGYYSYNCCTTDSTYCITLPDCQTDLCEGSLIMDDFFTMQGLNTTVLDVLANDGCGEGNFLITSLVTIVSGPANGSIVNIDPVTGAITYSPNPGFVGVDCFTYQVCCEVPAIGGLVCCPAQVCVDVLPDVIVCDPVDAPVDLNSSVLASQVLLTWTPIPLSVACQVQGQRIVPPGPTPVQNLIGFEIGSTNVPISLAGTGTTWRWRVRCACSIDPRIVTPYSNWDTFSIPVVRMAERLPELLVFPNPANDLLNVEFREFGETQVALQVLDVQGRVLLEQLVELRLDGQVEQLDISSLPAGVYSLSTLSDHTPLSSRFVKME